MAASLVISIALILISATVALVLTVAWHEFGRPKHAFTWAAAFGLSAVMWGVDLICRIERPNDGAIGGSMLAIAGIAAMLNTIGFRQRAGIHGHVSGLVAAALVNAVLVIGLGAIGAPASIRAMPFGLLNAAMFWFAARALKGGAVRGSGWRRVPRRSAC
ncbi:hypothetical protein [Sphingomonas sp. MMS24-J13]|uniref:hypothetical protein n=1 Tax=Sphingomonas sp. MMS24-J13 TaxID=3238686 RepID=UPI00384CCA03